MPIVIYFHGRWQTWKLIEFERNCMKEINVQLADIFSFTVMSIYSFYFSEYTEFVKSVTWWFVTARHLYMHPLSQSKLKFNDDGRLNGSAFFLLTWKQFFSTLLWNFSSSVYIWRLPNTYFVLRSESWIIWKFVSTSSRVNPPADFCSSSILEATPIT